MKKRDFIKSLSALSAAVAIPTVSVASVSKKKETEKVIVKIPIPVNYSEEWKKEQTIPGYIQKKMAWAEVDMQTGAVTPCSDDDPIYQHPLAQKWHSY